MFSRTSLTRALSTLALEHQAPVSASTLRPTSSSILPRRLQLHHHQKSSLHQSTALQSNTHSPKSHPEPPSPLSATPRADFASPSPNLPPSNQQASAKVPHPPTFDAPLKINANIASSLPHLVAQKPHFITAHLHDRPYLLTEGDSLRLPFLMPGVKPGDVLRLNRASVLGSREFSLKGAPYVDERLFECRVRVVATEGEPMRFKEKTKRRQRHVKTVMSKHRYTVLRVMEVRVKGVEEVLGEGGVVEG